MTIKLSDQQPVLLDLFCRMGGATVGYRRAGFHVIGVDIEPQPGYPGDGFYQEDALAFLANLNVYLPGGLWPILIHASPPCQDGNTATASNRARGIEDDHVQLVPPIRAALDRIGIPYVIEQPTSSRAGLIRRDVTLCMDMFKGTMPPPWVQKHRSFELGNWGHYQTRAVIACTPEHPEGPVRGPSIHPFKAPAGHAGYVRGHRHGVVRSGAEAPYVAAYGKGGGKGTMQEIAHAMGIDWMTDRFDLCEAIPPAYTQWLGTQFLAWRESSASAQ